MQGFKGSTAFTLLDVSDKFILLPHSRTILSHEVFMKIGRVERILNPGSHVLVAANAISLMNGRFDSIRPGTEVLKLSI